MSPATRTDPLIGKEVGGCLIEKCLGEGGMGRVYLAHHLGLDKEVALKILSSSMAADSQYVERFFIEARSAARLEHPHIVQVLNVDNDEGRYFIVMQYIDGETLEDLLVRRRRLPVSEAVRIVREVASALASAHGKDIVHRDIKPANLMLTREGKCVITDFGLARQMERKKGVTREGAFMGTPEYVSPEQAEGKELDARSDLYSLGVVFYEMVSGRVPFGTGNPLEIAMKHISDPPPPLKKIDPELQTIIFRLMEKPPGERYPSADALLAVLDGWKKGGKAVPSGTKKTAAPEPLPPEEEEEEGEEEDEPGQEEEPFGRLGANIAFWMLFLIAAGASVFLGGVAAPTLLLEPFPDYLAALARPFLPSTPGMAVHLLIGVMILASAVAAFAINRKEWFSSVAPVGSILLATGSLIAFFASSLFLPLEGDGSMRGMLGLGHLPSGFFRPTALPFFSLALFLPTLVAFTDVRATRGDRLLGALEGIVTAGLLFAWAFPWGIGLVDPSSPGGPPVAGILAAGAAVLFLVFSLVLAVPGRSLLARLIGAVLFVLGTVSSYVAGAVWSGGPGMLWGREVLAPVEGLCGSFIYGGPAVVPATVLLFWVVVLLYRKRNDPDESAVASEGDSGIIFGS